MASTNGLPPGGDEDRATGFVICVSITTIAALLVVALSIYVRTRIIRAVGRDDWAILLAMVFALLQLIFASVEVGYGYGRHEYYLAPNQQMSSTKYNVLATIALVLSTCFSKISVCLFVLRLLKDAIAMKRRLFLYICIVVLFVGNVLDAISLVVQCIPTEKIWDRDLPGSCWDPTVQQGFGYMQGGLSIVSALVLSAFPVLIFKDLQMSKRTKIGLSLLMGLGVFDSICSAVRTSLLPGFNASMDYSYTSVPISTWAVLEETFAIIAACIPVLRPLFRYFDHSVPHQTSSRSRTGYTMQKEGHQHPLASSRAVIADEEYGMSKYVSARLGGAVLDKAEFDSSRLPLRKLGFKKQRR